MKSIAIGLVAAFIAVALSPIAADAAKPAAGAAPVVGDAKSHTQGMADAPALIQQASVQCTPTDAYFVGLTKTKDAAGKDVESKVYEMACQEGLGYVIMAPKEGAPSPFDCYTLLTNKPKPGQPDKNSLYCRLPANADPVKGVQAIVDKSGTPCTVADRRYIGSNLNDKLNVYEIACTQGTGYIMNQPMVGSTTALSMTSCIAFKASDCQLFTNDKRIAVISALAAPANRPCQVSDTRYIGTTTDKMTLFELACGDKPGFVLQVDANYKFVSAVDCARAQSIAGGCTLTAASAAETEEIATYTKLAKDIGYPCAVKSYHSLGIEKTSGRELVELACSDHADGAMTLLPVDKGQTGEYFNCARAEGRQLKCSLTPPEATNAKLTAQLTAKGKSCKVATSRGVGTGATGDDYVEVACTGVPGFMVEYAPGPDSIKSIFPCAEAKGIGGGCTLPPG